MKHLAVSIIILSSVCSTSSAQEASVIESVLAILGAADPEEADANEIERIMNYLSSPLRLNNASEETLLSSGLLTRYQAISLADYRVRHGNIMSLAELASIDGFNNEYLSYLEPFITLSVSETGINTERLRCNMISKTGIKISEGIGYNYGIKARSRYGEKVYASISASSASSAQIRSPDTYSACISYGLRKLPLHLVIGDFNARFGQGLALWNGMTMSGVSSPDSFMRKQSGVSETWSFTGSSAYTGAAAEMTYGHMKMTSIIAFPGIKNGSASVLPAINITLRHNYLQAGMTHYCQYSFSEEWKGMKTSADIAACHRGTDIFGELVYDWANSAAAGLAGVIFPVGDNIKLSAMIRYYPARYDSEWSGAARSRTECSNEHSISLGSSFMAGKRIRKTGTEGFGADVRRHTATFSFDTAYLPEPVSGKYSNMQIKMHADWSVMISGSLQMKTRVTQRIRTWDQDIRTDFRLDVTWFSSCFNITSRLNALRYRNTGILAYTEGSYKGEKIGVHLRQGIFIVDDWDDRIYVYERDAPGSFNVPALYGRGVWTSLFWSWKISRSMKLDLRASLTVYPFMKERKPGKAELKLQYSLSF